MTDDLVQRLRRTYRKEYAPTGSMCGDNSNKPFPFPILATEVPVNPDGHEAADRIEALQAENARLQADNAKLREALMHYDAALKSSWPYGAKGDAWEHWNEARITLQEAGETFTRSSDT